MSLEARESFRADESAASGIASLSSLLLAYVVAVAAIATLAPFEFRWPQDPQLSFFLSADDVVLNLLLLLPAGFLFRVSQRGRGEPSCIDVLALGLLLSFVLEALQLFIPGRTSSPVDIVTNAAGAWVGAKLHSRLGPWFDRKLSQQLSFELPLSNVLYLLLPLVSLESVAHKQYMQLLHVLPLIALCSVVAASLYQHRFAQAAGLSALRYACAIGVYFGVGIMPVFLRYPAIAALEIVLVVVCVRTLIASQTSMHAAERRFQAATVARAMPFLIGYIVLLGAYPVNTLAFSVPELRMAMDLKVTNAQIVVLGLLAAVSAFTLLGYLVGELRARSADRSAVVLTRAAFWGLGLAIVFVCLRGEHPNTHATLSDLLLLSLASVAGAAIQRAQLEIVKSLRNRPVVAQKAEIELPAASPAYTQHALR